MSDIPALALAFLAGALLGVFFFGGLWWTVQKGMTSERPALWFLGSLLLRTGLILAGFYLVSQDHWSRLVMCLLGFLIARFIVVKRLTRARRKSRLHWKRRPALRLTPDDLVFWRYGFLELNSTIVTTWVLMLVMTVGLVDHAQARDRSAHLALARLPRNRGHHDPGTDQGSGPRTSGEISGFSGDLVPVHRGVNLCAIIPGYEAPTGSLSTTSAWPSRCLSPCPSSASRSKGWAVTSSPT